MDVKVDIGKRAKNKEVIREQLLSVAMKLFSTKGFERTTVADIVSGCNIGRGTFYNYFSDVKDIFDIINENINNEISRLTKTARKGHTSYYDLFYASFKAYFDFASSPRMIHFYQNNQAYIRSASYKSDSLKRIVKELIIDVNNLNGKTHFKKDREKQLLSYVLVGTPAELFLNNMSSANSQFDNHEVAEFLAKLFTSGISPE